MGTAGRGRVQQCGLRPGGLELELESAQPTWGSSSDFSWDCSAYGRMFERWDVAFVLSRCSAGTDAQAGGPRLDE